MSTIFILSLRKIVVENRLYLSIKIISRYYKYRKDFNELKGRLRVKPIFSIATIVAFILFISACQITEEEAIERSQQAFSERFASTETVEVNYEGDQIDFYLPQGMEITEEIDFNIQLEKDNQIFLLFFIPVEPWDSEVHLIRDQEFEIDAVAFEVLESDDKLGYLSISPSEEGYYKIIVGLGGAKITTISEVENVVDSTEIMTEILHSVQYKD